jgi:hypothetical protein
MQATQSCTFSEIIEMLKTITSCSLQCRERGIRGYSLSQAEVSMTAETLEGDDCYSYSMMLDKELIEKFLSYLICYSKNQNR